MPTYTHAPLVPQLVALRVQARLRQGVRDVVQTVRVRAGARRCGQPRALARVGGGHVQRLEAELGGVRQRLRALYVYTQPARLVVLHAAILQKYLVRPDEDNVPAMLLYPDPTSA